MSSMCASSGRARWCSRRSPRPTAPPWHYSRCRTSGAKNSRSSSPSPTVNRSLALSSCMVRRSGERRRTRRTGWWSDGDDESAAALVRIVAALGGNALLERGERPDAEVQERHVSQAVAALAPLAREHQLVITHGNGPQVGMLALESAHDPALSHPYPFDVLGAQTQGMIGYWLARALRSEIPGRQVGCLICLTLVSEADPAFANPTKFVG